MTLEPGDVRIFISYSHEDASHNLGVQAMAAKLEELGFDVFLDARQEIPPNSWSEQFERELPRADVVLCVCTPTYAERVDGEVPGGQGRGVAQEAALVRAEAYDQKMRADRFWVVHLEGSELAIPKVLGGSGTHCFRWPSDRDGLVRTMRAPTRRRRIVDALGEVFDDDVEALQEWAKFFVPLGRDIVLDFDDRALRVANGLLTHRDPAVTKQALQALVAEQRELMGSLDGVARALGLGALVEKVKGARDPSRPEPGSVAAEIEAAYLRREELTVSGEDTTAVDKEILELRRQQRQGPSLHPGEFLGDGRFRLVEIAGTGGFATVWKAYDRQEQALVAIKVLHGQFAQEPSRRERLFRGARKMAEIQHPNVVRVLVPEAEEQGFFYYVMEYVPGRDLYRAVVEGRVDTEHALTMLELIAEALGVAHDRGLVHRDVKPHNILLREGGTPVLSDFDLVSAKDTTGGTRTGAMGTVLYAAPEQNEDASRVDHRVDIFGLGMTAAFCVHGSRLPMTAIYRQDAFLANLECAHRLRGVIKKAVAIDPKKRYRTIRQFRAELIEAGCGGEGQVECVQLVVDEQSRQEDTRGNGSAEMSNRRLLSRRGGVSLVWVPGGTFAMGANMNDVNASRSEKPQHEVSLEGFYMARAPVTNAQYRRFLYANGDHKEPRFWGDSRYDRDNYPVVGISWYEASAFCEWAGLLLPTEAQWEYACRAGTTTFYWSGSAEEDVALVAWYVRNSAGRLHPVGDKLGNGFDLQDMHGNVSEWCRDAFESYAVGVRTRDGLRREPKLDAARVVRGGSFNVEARHLRSSYRSYRSPDERDVSIGFRPVRQRGLGRRIL